MFASFSLAGAATWSRRRLRAAARAQWTDANKEALLDAVRGGKGLVVYHFASSAFANPNWEDMFDLIA